ncbi:hypothetical protein DDT54_14265 [Brenneria nigrifluens DSM 30175 = ATCC 13028]|uniref:Uncharacterized protein n=1 Tax=Brenneria nigrifluens DSM 30175 = ATCC 13028 TaxID=1121120 RepID=A0A2U1UPD4_9GAMM|nr:hypothetical protein DDT54_14265 [Brenneria nigrifluens DSM 30175 = ATCC 13028]
MLFTLSRRFPLLFNATAPRNGASLIENTGYLRHKTRQLILFIGCLFSQMPWLRVNDSLYQRYPLRL